MRVCQVQCRQMELNARDRKARKVCVVPSNRAGYDACRILYAFRYSGCGAMGAADIQNPKLTRSYTLGIGWQIERAHPVKRDLKDSRRSPAKRTFSAID